MLSPEPAARLAPGLLSRDLDDLGLRFGPEGGTLRVWSEHADAIEVVVFDSVERDRIVAAVPLARDAAGVWSATAAPLVPGVSYALRATGPRGPRHGFDPHALLLDPYSRGLAATPGGDWRSVAVAGAFDWGGVRRPDVPLDRTVIYEAHVKGLTRQHPLVPAALRGTYAGLAHPAVIEHLLGLGVTSVELLPIHAFVSEPRLLQHGLTNYWGYNTLSFFSPHGGYATADARRGGAETVLAEFKTMVRALHEAGLEVILDVVYNHTAELERHDPPTSLRGIDNRSYYRQHDDGAYIDVTGCGNSVNTSTDAAARLVLDSLRYWADECQVDGFRLDLATTLGRDASHTFTPDHPLLRAIVDDPDLAGVKKIAEPWDIGPGGWQTGGFGDGWHEWNDRYRDRVRSFWLSDVGHARRALSAPAGIGDFATRLAGSSGTFSAGRGPLASVNFVTAHDGFTLHDLASYDEKHNRANREHNRDGTDGNLSFNHGAEGRTHDPDILATRRKAMRNLLGTLLLSAGVPMITAGDEFGRSQEGNNNPYCHDSPLTWLSWAHEPWQQDLIAHVRALARLRRENPALRPSRYAHDEIVVPSASIMDWYDQHGETMSIERWTDPSHRTLQYVATSTPEAGRRNRILLMVHGDETPVEVTLPRVDGVTRYVSLWSSAHERPSSAQAAHTPGEVVLLAPTSMHLFRAESD